jgi:hypothetical protein
MCTYYSIRAYIHAVLCLGSCETTLNKLTRRSISPSTQSTFNLESHPPSMPRSPWTIPLYSPLQHYRATNRREALTKIAR